MIFITKDNICEVPEWIFQGNEIISVSGHFNEILKGLHSIDHYDNSKYITIKDELKNQIKEHPAYIDLSAMQI
ncbi:MAG: hypothetical protein IKP49_12370 [Treponema sp.]|nr:hypothetical protein [Treponema sp.]